MQGTMAQEERLEPRPQRWLSPPTHVDLNITNACNLACTHCHASSGSRLPGELSTEEVLAVISQLHTAGVLSLVVAGGEPFSRRDVVQILAHACSFAGWQPAVVTNGLRLAESAPELAQRCPGLDVNVSIDGSTSASFAVLRRQRGGGQAQAKVFEQACQGVDAAVENGLHTSVNFTMTKATIDDLLNTYKLAVEELGASAMVAIKFFPAGYGKEHLDELDLPYREWAAAFTELSRRKLDGQIPRLQVSVPAAWEFYLPLIEAGLDVNEAERAWGYRAPLREPAYSRHRSVGDVVGIRELAIAPNGDVYPSVLLAGSLKAKCGSLRATSLEALFAGANGVLETIRSLDVDSLKHGCGGCGLIDICGGGSRIRGWSRERSWSAIDTDCPLTRSGGDSGPAASPAGGDGPPAVFPRTSLTFGTGPGALRLLRFEEGSELRLRNRVIRCSGAMENALDALQGGSPSAADSGDIEAAKSELRNTIEAAGGDPARLDTRSDPGGDGCSTPLS